MDKPEALKRMNLKAQPVSIALPAEGCGPVPAQHTGTHRDRPPQRCHICRVSQAPERVASESSPLVSWRTQTCSGWEDGPAQPQTCQTARSAESPAQNEPFQPAQQTPLANWLRLLALRKQLSSCSLLLEGQSVFHQFSQKLVRFLQVLRRYLHTQAPSIKTDAGQRDPGLCEGTAPCPGCRSQTLAAPAGTAAPQGQNGCCASPHLLGFCHSEGAGGVSLAGCLTGSTMQHLLGQMCFSWVVGSAGPTVATVSLHRWPGDRTLRSPAGPREQKKGRTGS